jgi:hypothetical protein
VIQSSISCRVALAAGKITAGSTAARWIDRSSYDVVTHR